MDFDDFLKKKNNSSAKYNKHNYHNKDRYKYYSNRQESFNVLTFIDSFKNNKKRKLAFILILIISIAVIIGLIAILFPLLKSIINYISQNGVTVLLDEVINFLNKLWNGTK